MLEVAAFAWVHVDIAWQVIATVEFQVDVQINKEVQLFVHVHLQAKVFN